MAERHFTFAEASPVVVAAVLQPDTLNVVEDMTWEQALDASDDQLGQVCEDEDWQERWRRVPRGELRAVSFTDPGTVTIRWGKSAEMTEVLSGATHEHFRCRGDPAHARTGYIWRTGDGICVQG